MKQLLSFRDDGFTFGTRVYYRGQHLEVDTDEHPHFLWGPDEQIEKLGRVFYALGPWDGALYDVGDPDLTPDEREKLEKANEEIIAARQQAKEAAEPVSDTPQEPARKRTPAKT